MDAEASPYPVLISQELDTPCIIGTKVTTKALQHGDEVEIDATRGVVTVLKQA